MTKVYIGLNYMLLFVLFPAFNTFFVSFLLVLCMWHNDPCSEILVPSSLDDCNTSSPGLPVKSTHRLQQLQNAAACALIAAPRLSMSLVGCVSFWHQLLVSSGCNSRCWTSPLKPYRGQVVTQSPFPKEHQPVLQIRVSMVLVPSPKYCHPMEARKCTFSMPFGTLFPVTFSRFYPLSRPKSFEALSPQGLRESWVIEHESVDLVQGLCCFQCFNVFRFLVLIWFYTLI